MHLGTGLTYIAYLDEFGHIGPYVSRDHKKYKESPVFGLAGFILPVEEVRSFGTWFYQGKSKLLAWEIKNDNAHAATWEKKGSALYTVENVTKYRELRTFTNRLLNKIEAVGGRVFYVGIKKSLSPEQHNSSRLYYSVLREAIKRIDQFCEQDCDPVSRFFMALDEHAQRDELLTIATQAMYQMGKPRRRMIEPPFQLESHRYQTMQAADWLAGLVGRLGAYQMDPGSYPDFEVFSRYFQERVDRVALRSSIRRNVIPPPATATL